MKAPDIVFRRDQWRERGRSYGQTHCRSRNPILREVEYEAPSVVDDEIVPSFNTTSDFYANTLVANVQKHAAAFEETLGNPDVETNGLITMGIVKALDLAGIRYPIGLRVCQLCKGTCSKIMPGRMVDTCKFQVCVGTLGGVKVAQGAQPSCSEISQP
ncbi:hypothetical protein BGZ72_002037 [Mortierella alpina]|nr:hypothetical protein BGZ72_002037 [Mortierella alpina]